MVWELWTGAAQLVVVGAAAGDMAGLVGALLSLLYPFPWRHTCVALLPLHSLASLQSPHPYVVGLLAAAVPAALPPPVAVAHVPLGVFTPPAIRPAPRKDAE